MKRATFFSIMMIIVMIVSTSTIAFADNNVPVSGNNNTIVFSDVSDSHWAKQQIQDFAAQGILNGYSDGTFKPNENVTREQFCKLLVNCFSADITSADTATFTDVSMNRWSFSYVETCKEFLTGYANPFGGMPSFHPAENATREDIAVALVRMMGLTDEDAGDKEYASYTFSDGGDISPSLVPYVSVACEKGLISGYPDGSFKPSKGITRAETVVLLNRSMKQAVTDIHEELNLSATVAYSDTGKTATIQVLADQGTVVTVDGQSVKMSKQYYGEEYEGVYTYSFTEEGSKTFVVAGSKAGKKKELTVTAKYEIAAPVLNITKCPTSSSDRTITIQGTVTGNGYTTSLTVNGESINVGYSGSWSEQFALNEGENRFVFVATNTAGKSVTQEKTVLFTVGGPKLTITGCPINSSENKIMIKGTLSDDNYGASLTINGESISVGYSGSWSQWITLNEGENKFVFVATNTAGKSVTQEKMVFFTVGSPELLLLNCPASTTNNQITIKGKVTGTNSEASLYINDEEVRLGYNKDFSATYTLSEGENTFRFRAVNGYGKSVEETRAIVYEPEVIEESTEVL